MQVFIRVTERHSGSPGGVLQPQRGCRATELQLHMQSG